MTRCSLNDHMRLLGIFIGWLGGMPALMEIAGIGRRPT
ncbi:hypothetical protein BALAC2494_01949 [Bifidobacterium animalis subsp. lactis CNCM I-2494]|uniref:Uncharacterized protein n=1 Tax=Bifidobacterium animalis subsp. lactis CNCM I-2494 TaxID=1042403 RepID=A0A806FHI2_BIFAN|nr:hypothetical protein BALAC2494_01949 [Bifidobacterium animalis subsp. lactis CNCM I-2494]